MDNIIFDEMQAAAYLKIGVSTLRRDRLKTPVTFPVLRYGGVVRYSKTALDNFVLSQIVMAPTITDVKTGAEVQPLAPFKRGRGRPRRVLIAA
jgi:hypothetical protein